MWKANFPVKNAIRQGFSLMTSRIEVRPAATVASMREEYINTMTENLTKFSEHVILHVYWKNKINLDYRKTLVNFQGSITHLPH